jgi:hypothetical protein
VKPTRWNTALAAAFLASLLSDAAAAGSGAPLEAPYIEELLKREPTPMTCFREKEGNPCGVREMAEQLYKSAHFGVDPARASADMILSARMWREYMVMLGSRIGQREALLTASSALRTGAYELAEQEIEIAMRAPDASLDGLALAWTMLGDLHQARLEYGYASHAYHLALELWSVGGGDPAAPLPTYVRPRAEARVVEPSVRPDVPPE